MKTYSRSVTHSPLNIEKFEKNTSILFNRNLVKSLVGHPVNANTLLHYNSKSIVYSFKNFKDIEQHVVFYWYGIDSKKTLQDIIPPTPVLLDGKDEALMVNIIIFDKKDTNITRKRT